MTPKTFELGLLTHLGAFTLKKTPVSNTLIMLHTSNIEKPKRMLGSSMPGYLPQKNCDVITGCTFRP